ncbi:MAG: GNAT family N-acetyltransferase [Desulfomonilia bacterium]|jgi:peptidoglycan pentaglycine glycine transferase (the first glycine)
MFRQLAEGYNVEIDSVREDQWYSAIQGFDDVNIYQTWAYGEVLWGRENLSHMVLRRDGDVVACAQVRIARVPFTKLGLAYIRGGPLWLKKNADCDVEVLQQAVRGLSNEYVHRRGLLLRIAPRTVPLTNNGAESVLSSEGYRLHTSESSNRTLYVDLKHSTEELRQAIQRQWRNNLKKAEKQDLDVQHGDADELYRAFKDVYYDMRTRKRFVEYVDIEKYQVIQDRLPEAFKMDIMVCRSDGNACAALVSSVLGDTAVNLLAATSTFDLENRLNGLHLLFWRMLEWAKTKECRWYDLGGINPSRNPGGYQFKSGIAGKKGIDLQSITQYEACASASSSLIVQCGDLVRSTYRKTKEYLLDGR